MHPHPNWIEIDLEKLRLNIRTIKSALSPSPYCLPIKANAYGHGLIEVAQIAQQEGVDYLAVAHTFEGKKLRQAGIKMPILVLGPFLEDQVQEAVEYNLQLSVSSLHKAKLLELKLSSCQKQAYVHIKVETGMQRIGARPQSALQIYHFLKSSQWISLKGIYSHLAFAENDDVTDQQIEIFNSFLKQIDTSNLICHLFNSTAVLKRPLEPHHMARCGLLTFGISSIPKTTAFESLEGIFSLKSRVGYFKTVEKGSGVGYGHTFRTTSRIRLATIPIGYGDGLRRDLSNQGHVLIRGKKCPIRGAICMDQLMVEVKEAYVGDEVVLIGKQQDQQITLQEVATQCQTIPYEILCGFNERVQRVYTAQTPTTESFHSNKTLHPPL